MKIIRQHLKPEQRVFVGVVAPIDPRTETPEEIRDRILEAARYIPVEQLGTTDDCGFGPFSDATSTSRDTAFRQDQRANRGHSAGRGSHRRRLMQPNDREEELLRAAAFGSNARRARARWQAARERFGERLKLDMRSMSLRRDALPRVQDLRSGCAR